MCYDSQPRGLYQVHKSLPFYKWLVITQDEMQTKYTLAPSIIGRTKFSKKATITYNNSPVSHGDWNVEAASSDFMFKCMEGIFNVFFGIFDQNIYTSSITVSIVRTSSKEFKFQISSICLRQLTVHDLKSAILKSPCRYFSILGS